MRCWRRCPRSGRPAGGRGGAGRAARPARRAGRAALPARYLRAGAAGSRPGRAGGELRTGHVDEVCARAGTRHRGAGGRPSVDADLVIDAGGRAGRLTRALRGPAQGGDCGIAYVSRQYQMRPGAAAGPVNTPFGVVENYPGYLAAVFIHDNRVISVLIARASADRPLAALRTRRRVRGRHAGDPGPGGLDRSGPGPADHPGPAGRAAVQQLPGAARRAPAASRWPG